MWWHETQHPYGRVLAHGADRDGNAPVVSRIALLNTDPPTPAQSNPSAAYKCKCTHAHTAERLDYPALTARKRVLIDRSLDTLPAVDPQGSSG